MSTIDLLKAIRSRVAQGWTQRSMARDSNGVPCEANSLDARAWCVYGAAVATSNDHQIRQAAYAVLSRVYKPTPRQLACVINDADHQTQRSILAWIDDAIASLEPKSSEVA